MQQPSNIKTPPDTEATFQDALQKPTASRFFAWRSFRRRQGLHAVTRKQASAAPNNFDWNRARYEAEKHKSALPTPTVPEPCGTLLHPPLSDFFRPTPLWLPPGRLTRSISAKTLICKLLCTAVWKQIATKDNGPVHGLACGPIKKHKQQNNKKQTKPHKKQKQTSKTWDSFQPWRLCAR